MTKPSDKSCAGCEYFVKHEMDTDEFDGHCHRYPPTIMKRNAIDALIDFPEVGENDWCGEHVDKWT